MKHFHFSEQSFPHTSPNKAPIISAQHPLPSIPDHRHTNLQWFPHLPIITPIFHGENFGAQPVKTAVAFPRVFGSSRGCPATPDTLPLVPHWSSNNSLPRRPTTVHWPVRTPQFVHSFLHNILSKWTPVLNATPNTNFCIFPLTPGLIFGTQGTVTVCFLLVLLSLVVLIVVCVFFQSH